MTSPTTIKQFIENVYPEAIVRISPHGIIASMEVGDYCFKPFTRERKGQHGFLVTIKDLQTQERYNALTWKQAEKVITALEKEVGVTKADEAS